MLVELKQVSKTYVMGAEEVHALRSVDIEIARGELVAVMGSSGSGKSTLLNIVGTLDRPTSGTYLLDGQDATAMDDLEAARFRNRKIGFVFQSFNLLPRDSALANVELPMVYAGVGRRERRRRAEEALVRVGLADRMRHRPQELSGGQQQRVSIARALVGEPVLLLADEPTGALDSETTVQIMDMFTQLHAQGMTVILVTHEPAVAAYAERVIRFKDGRVVADERRAAPADSGADRRSS